MLASLSPFELSIKFTKFRRYVPCWAQYKVHKSSPVFPLLSSVYDSQKLSSVSPAEPSLKLKNARQFVPLEPNVKFTKFRRYVPCWAQYKVHKRSPVFPLLSSVYDSQNLSSVSPAEPSLKFKNARQFVPLEPNVKFTKFRRYVPCWAQYKVHKSSLVCPLLSYV